MYSTMLFVRKTFSFMERSQVVRMADGAAPAAYTLRNGEPYVFT